MAKIKFYKGEEANLPTSITEGVVYVTTDTGKMFVDMDSDNRKQIFGAKLTIGNQVFDGSTDLTIPVYGGNIE